jgi:hypothetical protein
LLQEKILNIMNFIVPDIPAVREALISHMMIIGGMAIRNTYGTNSRHYSQVITILRRHGFKRIQISVFRSRRHCLLLNALMAVIQIQSLL